MSPPRRNLWSMLIILLGASFFLAAFCSVLPLQAQEATPLPDHGCLTCHENLYYLHDTGKWFCLCAEQMTCTCCHGGNPDALGEEEAHTGMVLYPTRNNATACQQCHPDDYQARAERFAEVAGISQFHPAIPTITASAPSSEISAGFPPAAGTPVRLLEPWRLAALALLGIVMIVLAVLGYRCWRADCLAKRTN